MNNNGFDENKAAKEKCINGEIDWLKSVMECYVVANGSVK